MKKASLISFALFFIMAGQAVGDAWYWPPTGGAMVTPQNPTSSDVVAITLSGEWPHSCIPNDSAILVMGNDIYFDVILDYPPGACLTVITYWERTESVGPLPPGTYTVYTRLIGDPFVPEMYMPMAEFTVTGLYYVDTDAAGANDGTSWADAFRYLQDALAAARYGDEIRIAQGIYRPDEDSLHPDGTDNRKATFRLINGIAIRGGYAGFDEPDPNARDSELYETILSGDLNGDDVGFTNNGENSYHVVTGSETNGTAVLDGLTITGGNADGLGEDNHEHGGGMFNDSGSPTLANCTFTGNYAVSSGGGMWNWKSSTRLTNCEFNGNTASECAGGMNNHSNSNPTVTNCEFNGNSAKHGGGMFNYNMSSPRLINCTFSSNSASWDGGGMTNSTNSSPTLTNCTFSRNTAPYGGGMWNHISSPSLINCTFTGNSARDGGGMGNHMSSPTLTNCTLIGNSALYGGGIHNYDNSNPTVTNCRFTGNEADYRGGGMDNDMSRPTLTNCTFSGNSAKSFGGAMSNIRNSNPTLTNCILWGDSAPSGPEILNRWTSYPIVSYCDVQGGWPGTSNINADPLFLYASGGDLRLLPGSPCIDAGDNSSVPEDITDLDGDENTAELIPWDLDGNLRIVDGHADGNAVVDMGAYEYVPPIEVRMKFTPQALNPGSKGNWMKAHFVLPEEYTVEDVDANRPAVVEPGGIESDYMNVFVNEDGFVEIEAAFGRAEFCSIVTGGEPMEVTVVGWLTGGRQFYGTDTIKITTNTFEYLAVLASHWLEVDCGKPDWCGGTDLDQDSLVNFVDFALFDGCCIEIVRE